MADAPFQYSCTCSPGFDGFNCDVDIDECATAPCPHGTCTDWVNGYTCLCDAGWSGENCAVDIDECESVPCHNNDHGQAAGDYLTGTCVDQIDHYVCNCNSGWDGENCQTEVMACESFELSNCDFFFSTCHYSGPGQFYCHNDMFRLVYG